MRSRRERYPRGFLRALQYFGCLDKPGSSLMASALEAPLENLRGLCKTRSEEDVDAAARVEKAVDA